MVTASLSSADAWLGPLDRVRTALFVRALSSAPLRAVLVDKRRRVPALLLVHASVAFVLSLLAPTLLLVLGPLLLGVPHLVSEVRYLVLRPSLGPGARRWLLGGAAVLLALRLSELLGFGAALRFELPLAALWIGGSAWLAAPHRRDPCLLVVGALAAAFGVLAWLAPSTVRLVMAHAHNPLALGAWALIFSQAPRRALAVVLAVGLAALLLLVTPVAWLGFKHGVQSSFGLHGFVAADQLAPFAHSVPLALVVVASFAFLQSVHYAVWLHAIPQEATPGQGTLSFRMSFRALQGELGRWGLGVAALLVVAVPVAGVCAPLRTQSVYLSLATFHGYLELGALAIAWLNRRAFSSPCRSSPPGSGPSPSRC
jgi:hypothetical protein